MGVGPRQTDAGIARAPGLAVAAVTAGIVFLIGQQLFPVKPRQPALPPPPPAIAETPPAAVADAAAVVAVPPAIEASAVAAKAADAGAAVAVAPEKKNDEAVEPEKGEKPAKAEKPEPSPVAKGTPSRAILVICGAGVRNGVPHPRPTNRYKHYTTRERRFRLSCPP